MFFISLPVCLFMSLRRLFRRQPLLVPAMVALYSLSAALWWFHRSVLFLRNPGGMEGWVVTLVPPWPRPLAAELLVGIPLFIAAFVLDRRILRRRPAGTKAI